MKASPGQILSPQNAARNRRVQPGFVARHSAGGAAFFEFFGTPGQAGVNASPSC
jgi:hypothetical protein